MQNMQMGDFNIDLSEVSKAQEVEQQKLNEEAEAAVVKEEDGLDKKHKVLFYIILGISCLTPIGIGILVWLLIKTIKKNKQLQTELDASKGSSKTEDKPADKPEEKSEEKKEESKQEEKPSEKKK